VTVGTVPGPDPGLLTLSTGSPFRGRTIGNPPWPSLEERREAGIGTTTRRDIVHTLCIAGSPLSGSTTKKALERCQALLVEAGGEATLLDLHEMALPPMSLESYSVREKLPSCVNDFTAQVLAADAIVLGTPVHHATFSGLLKVGLDHLDSDAFNRKPVGLISTVGGPRGGSAACDHLRAVVKALGGWAVPTQVVIHRSDFDREIVAPVIDDRLGQMVSELSWFSGLALSA
jgi:NAD(P)H-dependent FMN reductase